MSIMPIDPELQEILALLEHVDTNRQLTNFDA